MDKIPDHPDIVATELTGYPSGHRDYDNDNVVGYCEYCANPILNDESYIIKHSDGTVFCSPQCLLDYYELEEINPI